MIDLDKLSIVFIVLSGATVFVISWRRHRRDLQAYLEPPLRECGLTYISAISPKLSKIGPFPLFEVELGRPQSNIGGITGEYHVYKIVSFSTPQGEIFRLWALVEFEMFQFRRVRWRAEQKNSLPPQALPILEN